MISMQHVYKTYLKIWPALKDINVTISKGDFVFLTGPSGAGKSTFLKLIYCEERPSRGDLFLFGEKVGHISHHKRALIRQRIGVVFQDFKLIIHKTAYENLALASNVVGLMPSLAHRRILEVVNQMKLSHKLHVPVYQLSGGEQQRIAIARALVTSPDIILADEPTGNLDPAIADSIMEVLKQLNAQGATIIMATHNYALIERYPFKKIHIAGGTISG